MREGPGLQNALEALPKTPDLVLVNATGRDHPRKAGLALHLGARLGVATVGVTNRTLLAQGESPARRKGSKSGLWLEGEQVGCWLRTRSDTAPVAVHAAWLTSPEMAAEVVLKLTGHARTPLPIRSARALARRARALTSLS
jgi:deoxyribonuclease V